MTNELTRRSFLERVVLSLGAVSLFKMEGAFRISNIKVYYSVPIGGPCPCNEILFAKNKEEAELFASQKEGKGVVNYSFYFNGKNISGNYTVPKRK